MIKLNHFEYRIYNEVYDEIASGKKTIEFRLLNKKTESIKQGDEIQFKVLNNEDKYILVEVTNKYIYDSLEELWNHKEIMSNALNYSKKEFINVFYNIFGKEKVENSKIVGIEFKLKFVK